MEKTLLVAGMHCMGCENRINNACSTIENVNSIKANHEDGTVLVSLENEEALNKVINKIEDLGFEVTEVK